MLKAKRLKSLTSGLTISIFSILISLLIAEGIARIYLPAPLLINVKMVKESFQSKIPRIPDIPESDKNKMIQVDLTLGYYGSKGHRYRPNVSATVDKDPVSSRTIEYKTNSLGMLDKEITARVNPDQKRFLFIGDSITAGVGVPQEERFTNLLGQIHSDQSSSPIQFINAGITGANAEESFLHYTEINNQVSPDVVVFNLYLNDANRSRFFLSTVPTYPYSESYLASWFINSSKALKDKLSLNNDSSYARKLKWREEFRAGRTFDLKLWRREYAISSLEGFDYAVYSSFLDWGLGWSDVAWEEIAQTLRAFKQLTEQNNQRFVVLLSPVTYQVYSPIEDFRPNTFFKNVCNSLNIECLDLLFDLRTNYQQNKKRLYYDQCHFNTLGHQVVAEILERRLILN